MTPQQQGPSSLYSSTRARRSAVFLFDFRLGACYVEYPYGEHSLLPSPGCPPTVS